MGGQTPSGFWGKIYFWGSYGGQRMDFTVAIGVTADIEGLAGLGVSVENDPKAADKERVEISQRSEAPNLILANPICCYPG